METPLTPLEFLRRTRKLHGAREAVVDGDTRLTYAQFAQRCDLWSAALFALGVRRFVKALPKMATGKIQKFVLRGGQAAISRQ